ncbi:MAG: hypothetical protein AABY58_00335 [Nitrospirota bacterium]
MGNTPLNPLLIEGKFLPLEKGGQEGFYKYIVTIISLLIAKGEATMNVFLLLTILIILLYVSIFLYMKILFAMNLRRGDSCQGMKRGISSAYYPKGRG